jgi:hypothetical protein
LAFLNGDWLFINAVLGLMSPSATHPALSASSYTATSCAPLATALLPIGCPSTRISAALVLILPKRVVPTPLHVFLGISNRIIFGAFHELFGESAVEQAVQRIKTAQAAAGCPICTS